MPRRVRLTGVRGHLSVALLMFLACSGERATSPAGEGANEIPAGEIARAPLPLPSMDDAARIVSGSAEFSDYQFTRAAFTLPVKESAMTPEVRETSRALAKAGWIGIDGDGNVVLTGKAKKDKRFLLRQNGFLDIVPMAKKEFLGVQGVHVNPEGEPLVDFRWKWVPNEIGALTADRYAGEQLAIATLLWDGSQWTVLRITGAVSVADRAWIDTAIEAWRVTSVDALKLDRAPMPEMILFDETCTSSGKKHEGTITLPDGEKMPAQVTSFAGSHDGKPFLVMALPSVWRKVPRHAENRELDRLTTAVFVHEMTHTVQSKGLAPRIGALIEKYKLKDDEIDDDIVQNKFGKDPAHLAAYEKERDLFYASAAAADAVERRKLMNAALAAMRDRRARFLTGQNAVYAQLEDVFLMMEGAANWAAMKHVAREMPVSAAIESVRGRRHRWTQDEGLAIFLAIDAATDGWQARVLGDDPPSLELLIENVASGTW